MSSPVIVVETSGIELTTGDFKGESPSNYILNSAFVQNPYLLIILPLKMPIRALCLDVRNALSNLCSGRAARRTVFAPTIRTMVDLASDDTDFEITNTIDVAVEYIATVDSADARGRSRKDDVSGQQRKQARQIVDHLRNLPDHLV